MRSGPSTRSRASHTVDLPILLPPTSRLCPPKLMTPEPTPLKFSMINLRTCIPLPPPQRGAKSWTETSDFIQMSARPHSHLMIVGLLSPVPPGSFWALLKVLRRYSFHVRCATEQPAEARIFRWPTFRPRRQSLCGRRSRCSAWCHSRPLCHFWRMSGLRATLEVAGVHFLDRDEGRWHGSAAWSILRAVNTPKIGATYFRSTSVRARDGGHVQVPPGGEFLMRAP
jgi:hypothetical protein